MVRTNRETQVPNRVSPQCPGKETSLILEGAVLLYQEAEALTREDRHSRRKAGMSGQADRRGVQIDSFPLMK